MGCKVFIGMIFKDCGNLLGGFNCAVLNGVGGVLGMINIHAENADVNILLCL